MGGGPGVERRRMLVWDGPRRVWVIPGGDNRCPGRLERDVGPGGRVAGTRHVPRAEKTGTEHVPRAEETRVGEMEAP